MIFRGQTRIMREVDILTKNIIRGYPINIALIAQSGMGKTTLGLKILGDVGIHQSQVSGPPDFNFDFGKRHHLFDEVHELKYPEALYEIMDRGDYTMLLATNESGDLKEPLLNRCIPLIFEAYTEGDLYNILGDIIGDELSKELYPTIIDSCKSNPRELKVLAERLLYVNREVKLTSVRMLKDVMEDILNIYGGLNQNDRIYLDKLDSLGGMASLTLLENSTGLSKSSLLRLEPELIANGYIKISSRGRVLVKKY